MHSHDRKTPEHATHSATKGPRNAVRDQPPPHAEASTDKRGQAGSDDQRTARSKRADVGEAEEQTGESNAGSASPEAAPKASRSTHRNAEDDATHRRMSSEAAHARIATDHLRRPVPGRRTGSRGPS